MQRTDLGRIQYSDAIMLQRILKSSILVYFIGKNAFAQDVGVTVDSNGTKITWQWSDWLGLSILILVIAFVIVAVSALRQGAPALKVLDQTGRILMAAFRKK